MHSRLDGRVAVVTGGSRGLGRAMSLELAARGVPVLVVYGATEFAGGVAGGKNLQAVLFGGAAHFSSKFGLFGEVGWLQHRFSHSAEVGQDYDFKLQQWCLNLGIVVRN